MPLHASPTTSWPAWVIASLTTIRMNTASSATRMRAISLEDRERRGRLGQGLADGLDHAVRLERLDHEVLRAQADGLEHLRLLPEGRAHDDLRRRIGGHDVRK